MSWAAGQLWAVGYREWLPPVPLRSALACLWVSVTAPDRPSLTLVLPEPSGRSLEQISRDADVPRAAELLLAEADERARLAKG